MLGVRRIDREIHFYDEGIYVTNAKALATNAGYRNISLPDAPAQAKYPPVVALALSVVLPHLASPETAQAQAPEPEPDAAPSAAGPVLLTADRVVFDTGTNTVTVTVPQFSTGGTRQLTATIAGQTFTVNQTGVDCTVALSPYSASAPATGTLAERTGSVAVTTPAGCSYATVLGPSWITVTSGETGTGSGTLVYVVDPNSTTTPRTGTLTIGGQAFQITQEPRSLRHFTARFREL